MWSFLRKQKSTPIIEEKRQLPKSLNQLMGDMSDFSDLAKHDVALKFWLPEPAKDALEEIKQLNNQSVSSQLRQFLIIHCYGFYPYLVMTEAMPKFCQDKRNILFSKREDTPEGKKRVSTYWVVDLGKNIAPIKLWVPTRLKQDLTILAEHTGLTLSNYMREIVISRLLGHGMLPKRPEMMTSPTQNAQYWEEDKELHWIEVDSQTFEKYPIQERHDTWVENTDSA